MVRHIPYDGTNGNLDHGRRHLGSVSNLNPFETNLLSPLVLESLPGDSEYIESYPIGLKTPFGLEGEAKE